ncbi:MAG TPA: hypothetical protein VMS99_01305 [Acidimicrobiia bacterium]|nr:hypothetical protein [Acidimicrobiia bacterium]
MWEAAFFYAMLLVVPLPAAVVTGLKGRWWMGVGGFVGFGSLAVFFSEAYSDSPLHLIWMIGLSLLVLGSTLVPTPGSWWDRRFENIPRSRSRVLLIGSSLPLALALGGVLVPLMSRILRLPTNVWDQGGVLIVIGGAMAAILVIVVSLFAVLTKESKVSLVLTGLGAGLPVIAFAVTFALVTGLFQAEEQTEEPVSVVAIEFITCMEEAGYQIFGVDEGPDPVTGELTITGFASEDGHVPEDLVQGCIQAAVG